MHKRIIFFTPDDHIWDRMYPIAQLLIDMIPNMGAYLHKTILSSWRFSNTLSSNTLYALTQRTNPFSLRLSHAFSSLSRLKPATFSHIKETIFVTSSDYRPKDLRPSLNISIRHGSGFGIKDYALRVFPTCDIYCGMHERERDYLSLHFPASEINRKFILTGCVTHQRCLYQRDMIASHGKSFIDKEKRALGLPLDRPIILVCSHWRYKSIFAKWGASLVLKLAEQLPNMLIVQNFHPLCRLITNKSKHHDGAVSRFIAATSKDSEILAQGLNRALCHPNVYVFDGLDNSRLLSVCDALISDHSSVAIEFAVFNKPIFIHDETEFSDKLSEMLYNQASERFQSLQELEKKLENLESRSDENIIQGRAAMRDAFVSSISRTATKNIASAVIRQYQSDRLAAD